MTQTLLSACGWGERRPPRCLIFVAHPDDETLALGGQLPSLADVRLAHATDGAPRDLQDARAYGFDDAAGYAAARREELRAAMRVAGVAEPRLCSLGFADQQAAHHLVELTLAFLDRIERHAPDLIFTNAYEGGHPDHDAVAFAARAALRLHRASPRPRLYEFPLYRLERAIVRRQQFAPGVSAPAVLALSAEQQARKREMLACFATQTATLSAFGLEQERVRLASPCDFREPHAETLYDRHTWNCSGAQFVAQAQDALGRLRLPPWL